MSRNVQQQLERLLDLDPSDDRGVERIGAGYKLFISRTFGGLHDIVHIHKLLEQVGLIDNSREPMVGEYEIATTDGAVSLGFGDGKGGFYDRVALSDNASAVADMKQGYSYEINFGDRNPATVARNLSNAVALGAAHKQAQKSGGYVDRILGAFLKLDDFYLADAHTRDEYLTYEQQGDHVVLTLDTRYMDLGYINRSKKIADKIVERLRANGIEDTQIINQYSDFDNPGNMLSEVPEGDSRWNDNKVKLVITVPDTLDTVVKLRKAHRAAVIEAATQAIQSGMEDARDLVAGLGKAEAGMAMRDVMELAGIETSSDRFRG